MKNKRSKGNGSLNVNFGELRDAIRARAAKDGVPDAELVRRAVAAYLGESVPTLERGNPAFREAAKK